MSRRTWMVTALVLLAGGGAAWATRSWWSPVGAVAQQQKQKQQARTVPVEIARAVRKQVPVRFDALGTVIPIASVAVKSRLETEIVTVHFTDGTSVKAGDLLFTLDSRALEAQIKQAEGVLARDRAQLEGAERDVRRYSELVARNATPVTNLDNAKTQADAFRAAIKADEAALENLKVQLSYTRIRAPISGRLGAAAVKVGNFVRPADMGPLVTINQVAPIYVAFAVPQRLLAELRDTIAEGTAGVEAVVPGSAKRATGRLSMVDNTVDATTGTVMIRATMDNADELLWPGTLVNVRLTLRIEDSVVVPTAAVQVSQTGSFVYVVKDGAAMVRPVTVARTFEAQSVITSGLADGETVVTDGHLLLTNGVKVNPRDTKAGS